MTKRIVGKMKDGFDKLKIGGKTFYAWGEFRSDTVGKNAADRVAKIMRTAGHHARIVRHKTGYQVYCDSQTGAMMQ